MASPTRGPSGFITSSGAPTPDEELDQLIGNRVQLLMFLGTKPAISDEARAKAVIHFASQLDGVGIIRSLLEGGSFSLENRQQAILVAMKDNVQGSLRYLLDSSDIDAKCRGFLVRQLLGNPTWNINKLLPILLEKPISTESKLDAMDIILGKDCKTPLLRALLQHQAESSSDEKNVLWQNEAMSGWLVRCALNKKWVTFFELLCYMSDLSPTVRAALLYLCNDVNHESDQKIRLDCVQALLQKLSGEVIRSVKEALEQKASKEEIKSLLETAKKKGHDVLNSSPQRGKESEKEEEIEDSPVGFDTEENSEKKGDDYHWVEEDEKVRSPMVFNNTSPLIGNAQEALLNGVACNSSFSAVLRENRELEAAIAESLLSKSPDRLLPETGNDLDSEEDSIIELPLAEEGSVEQSKIIDPVTSLSGFVLNNEVDWVKDSLINCQLTAKVCEEMVWTTSNVEIAYRLTAHANLSYLQMLRGMGIAFFNKVRWFIFGKDSSGSVQ